MSSLKVRIRKMKTSDLPQIKALCEAEGWNHSYEYLEESYTMYPEGFHVAVREGGDIVCHCGGIMLNETLAFIGLYITREDFRRLGIGQRVFRATLNALGDVNIGLNATEATAGVYNRCGFRVLSYQIAAYHIKADPKSIALVSPNVQANNSDLQTVKVSSSEVRNEDLIEINMKKVRISERRQHAETLVHRTGTQCSSVNNTVKDAWSSSKEVSATTSCLTGHEVCRKAEDVLGRDATGMEVPVTSPAIKIFALRDYPFKKVKEYDDSICPVPRSEVLKQWFASCIKTYVAADRDGATIGYGCLQAANEGYRVMPLYADSLDVATKLYESLLGETPKRFHVEIAVPIGGENAGLFLQRLGIDQHQPAFVTTQMFTRAKVEPQLDKVYSVFTFDSSIV